MVLQYYVVENATGKQIEIDIESATNEDLTSTKEKWQSDWTSEFIRDPKLEKYAAKTDAGEYAVFLHATTRDDKHWPEEHWRELIGLLADSGIRIKLPWGAPHEEERAKRLAEGFAYVEVLPKMSLEGVARVLAGAKFVVSVDTGLSHLTAALDRPNITVYGPTDPGLIGGYGKNQMVCRAPLKSLNNLEAAAVYKKITLI